MATSTFPSTGNDSITGTLAADLIDALAGNDTIRGMEGNDSLIGNVGNDSIDGGSGSDTLMGGDGNDSLEGGLGNDSFDGGLGADRFYLGRDDGSDTIDGGGYNTRTPWPSLLTVPNNGDDYDRLIYRDAANGITLNLSARTVSVPGLSGVDSYINVEEVWGSPGKDTVTGRPSQGFFSNPSTGHSFFFWGLGGSDVITQTPYGYGARWTDGLQVGYSWSETGITVNWVGAQATVSYGAGTGVKSGSAFPTPYAAGTDTLTNVLNLQTSDLDDVINGQGATLNHLGYLTNPYQRISYFIVDARGGNDVVRGNGNFLLIPSVNTATSATPADGRGINVDGRTADASGLVTMDLSHLKAAYSASVAHGSVKFSGVSYVFGTPWNDTVYAGNGIYDFRGQGGNDTFIGNEHNNLSSYRSATNPITVNLAQGTVTDRLGGTSTGNDTLRGVEQIEGTRYDDVFDATGFSENALNAGGIAAGWKGMRNWYTPLGGNDTVTGNGYTALSFTNAAMLGIKADLAAGVVDSLASDAATRNSSDYLYTVGRTTFTGVAGVEGTDYADWLIGGTNTMFYGTGSLEVFSPRGGADTVDGGSNYDIVYYTSSPNPIRVDMRLATGQVIDDGWGSTDTLINVERVEGSHFNDSYIGSSADYSDFRGGRGADTIDGGAGYDEVSYSASRLTDPTGVGGVIVDLGGTAVDPATRSAMVVAANVSLSANGARPVSLPAGFTGWARDNWGDIDLLKDVEGVEASDWDDVLIGSDSVNRLDGAQGNDTIDGAGGVDWVEYNGAEAGVVVSLAAGEASNDGAGYRDVLRNIENVQGSIFGDRIIGDAGANQLEGEAGNDTFTGGAGSDSFLFPARLRSYESSLVKAELDQITDFTSGDQLVFDNTVSKVEVAASSLLAGQVKIETVAGGARIFVGRDSVAGADLTIDLPSVDASRLVVNADNKSISLVSAVGLPTIQFTATAGSASEGNSGNTTVTVQATLSASSTQAVTVPVTYSGTATPGTDYTNATTSITIAAGQTSGSASFSVVGDTTVEPNETVVLTMGTPTNATLGEYQSYTHTIANDDTSAPVNGVAGIAYHWRSHVLLSGVTVSTGDQKAVQADSDLFDLRGASFDAASGTLTVQLWVNPVQASTTFDVSAITKGATSASFSPSLSASTWTVLANTERPNDVLISGYLNNPTASGVTGPLQLGTLTMVLTPNAPVAVNFKNLLIGNSPSADVNLTLASATTDANGAYALALADGSYALTVSRAVGDGSNNNGVTSADALAALKIAVGINPNTDPDGSGPLQAQLLSPYQVMAADVNGDGKVTAADAQGILKMSVKLADAPAPAWMFVEEDRDFYDEATKAFTLTRLSAAWDQQIKVTLPADAKTNLVGVLKGDVNGSWTLAGATTVEAFNPNYFKELASLIGVPTDQWAA